jgi:hypothetical protein
MAFPILIFIDAGLIPKPSTLMSNVFGAQTKEHPPIPPVFLPTPQHGPDSLFLLSTIHTAGPPSENTPLLVVTLLNDSLCNTPTSPLNVDNSSLNPLLRNTVPLPLDTNQVVNRESHPITIVGSLICYKATTELPLWTPSHPIPHASPTTNCLSNLISSQDLPLLQHYTSCPPTTVTLGGGSNPGIYITTRDLQDFISFNQPIYHELLIFSLENLCQ